MDLRTAAGIGGVLVICGLAYYIFAMYHSINSDSFKGIEPVPEIKDPDDDRAENGDGPQSSQTFTKKDNQPKDKSTNLENTKTVFSFIDKTPKVTLKKNRVGVRFIAWQNKGNEKYTRIPLKQHKEWSCIVISKKEKDDEEIKGAIEKIKEEPNKALVHLQKLSKKSDEDNVEAFVVSVSYQNEKKSIKLTSKFKGTFFAFNKTTQNLLIERGYDTNQSVGEIEFDIQEGKEYIIATQDFNQALLGVMNTRVDNLGNLVRQTIQGLIDKEQEVSGLVAQIFT
jgi:hypothetical protein